MPYIDQFLKDYPEYQGKDEQALAKALYDSHFSDQGSFEDFKAEFLGTGSSVIQDFAAGVVAGAPKLVGGILGLPAAAHDTAVVAGEAATGNRYQNDGGMVVKASRYAADKLNELGNYLGDSLHTDEYTRVNKQFAATPDKGNAFSLADWQNGNNVADMTDTLAHLGKNPTQVAGMIGESLPSLVAPIVAARAASINGLNATRAAIATGAGLEGSSAATDARDRVMKLPEEVLAKDEVYQAFLEAGYAPELAREAVALRAGGVAFPIGAGVSAVSSKLLGAGKFEADIGTGALGAGKLFGAGRGLVTETPQEFVESGASAYAANEGVKQFGNEQQSRSEGVLKQATQGAVAGGIVGAGMGFVSAPKGQPINYDYANATPEQIWGLQPMPTVAPDMRPDISGSEGIDLTGNQSNQSPVAQGTNKAQAKAEEDQLDQAMSLAIEQANINKNAMQDQALQQLMPQDPELQAMAANGVPVVEITPEASNIQANIVPTNGGQSQDYPTLDNQLPDINTVKNPVVKPEVKLFGGNTPFKTVKSAEIGKTFKTTPNARIVPVEGGYGVVDGKAWDEYEAATLPKPEDTAYGRLEQQRIQANNMAKPAPTVPDVDVEAAYRQREAELERQKQLDYADAQVQAAEQEYQNILKLQSETPIENTALRKELASKLMDAEIKRLMEIENRQQIMESGNPRLVEAGIEEMQGEPTPDLPMPITPELEPTAQVKLPENFTDERLANDAYRVVLGDVMEQSMTGGVQLIAQQGTGYTGGDGNEYGQQVIRTKSMNSPITQALIADGYTADEVRNALDAALKGQKLGKRWQGLVTKALDYSNTDAADIQAQMAEFEQAKAADVAPENLGYGDAVNAPFAPDNAQPVTMREQAMPRGAEGGVKFSVGGKTGGIDFGGQSKLRTDDVFQNPRVTLPRSVTAQTDKLLEDGELLDMPQVDVPVSDIVPTQSFISQSNIDKIKKSTSSTNAELAKIGDKYYVLDGHHRIAKRIANGDEVVQAHVVEIDADGVKFSFAGQKAKTANLENLSTAEQMLADGVDADTVWKQTGWEKGADGQWKFEIDDSGAKLKTESSNPDKYDSVFDEAAKRRKGVYLSQIIDHEKLFSAYPDLKKARVFVDDDLDSEAAFDPEDMGIFIKNPLNSNKKRKELVSAILHEVQHAIQEIEGFAKGGSPDQMEGDIFDQQRSVLKNLIMVMGFLGKTRDEAIDGLGPGKDKEIAEKYFRGMSDEVFDFGVKFLMQQEPVSSVQISQYESLAGETEARNTQYRQKMKAKERRNTPPRMTEDVARDKQIIRFEGGRAEMAIREVDGFVEIDGSTDIAYLDLKGYRESAPIRLEVGDESFGLEHVKAHEDQILNAGFDSVEQFIRHVANNFTEVRKGNHGRLILDIPNKNTGDMMTVMLKMSDDGGFWSVSNAAIVRMKYLEKFEKLPVVSGDGSRNASGKRQGLSQSSEYQTTIGADNALPTGNSDITTPKSEVNTLKQELAKSKDAQRLINSGKVEVVQSERDLPADIEGMITKSDANGQVQGLFNPATNKTYLIADNLSAAAVMGVLTHEVGVHAWFNTANSEKKAALEKRAVSLLKTRDLASGGLRPFLDSVQQRMVDAGHVDSKGNITDNEEAVAYIVEEAINQFGDSRYLLNDNKLLGAIGKASKSLANFIADVITYLKSSMHKLGWMDTQNLTAGDLIAIAKGNMREVAQNDVGVNDGIAAGDVARTLASFASDKPTAQEIADAQRELDKQLAIADKLEAEYGYLPAPNGEKSNLNRNQWAQVRTPQFKEFYGDWKNESGRIYREMDGDTGSALNTRTEGASSAGRYRGRSGNESVLSGVREGKQLNIEQVRLDDNGEPRIYYHGTKDSFDSFDTNHPNRKDKGWLGRGVYVAGSKGLASMYARQKNGSGDKRVLELFVAVRNPYIANPEVKNNLKYASQEAIDQFTQDAIANGYDGVAVQYPNGEVELVSFDPKLVKSATDNIGTFSNKTGNIRFSKQGNQPKNDLIAPEFKAKDKVVAKKIDRFHRLKQLQDMVQEKTGDKSVAVYDAAMRYFAVAPSKLLDMQRGVERSLKSMAKNGIDRNTLANYMYAVHAPERNAYIKAKNGTENGSGMTDQQAKDIADGLLAQHPLLKKYAADWRKMLDEAMQERINNGTVSQKQADEWKAAMPNYVPLKNAVDDADAFEMETGIVTQKALFGTGQRFNLKGKEFKEALGRTSLAGDIVEHMVFDMQRGIVRSQKNAAMIEFARAVARHVDAVGSDGKKLWKVLQKRPDTDMDKVVEFMVDGRKNYIQVFDEPTLDALKGLNEDGFTAWDSAIQFLKKTITAWNPAFTIVNTIRDGEGAAINATQELGAKGAAKMMRYVGGAAKAAFAYERDQPISDATWKKYHELYRFTGGKTGFMDVRSINKLKSDIEKLAKNEKPISLENWLGKTGAIIQGGFKAVEDVGSMTENMYRLAAFRVAIEQGKTPKEAARIAKNLTVNFDRKGSDVRSMERWFLFYNAAMQGTIRMSETLTSKGALTIVGGLIASGVMLGLMGGWGGEDEEGNTLFDLLPEHELMRTIPFWIGGERFNIPMAYGFGYFTYTGMKIGQYIRYLQSNGRNGHSIDKVATGLLKGVAMHFNPFGGLQAADATLGDSDAFELMLAPVLADPLVSVLMNKSWLGTPLYPENPYNPNDKPDSEKAFDYQKESAYYDIAKFFSRATGGDGVKPGKVEVAAGEIEAFVRGYTGGLGNFIGSVANVGYLSATGRVDEITLSKIPVVSTLAKGNSTDRLYYQAYKEAVENVKEAQNQLKQYNEGKSDDGKTAVDAQNNKLLNLIADKDTANKGYKALRDNEKKYRDLWLKAETSEDRKKYKAALDAAKKATAKHQAEFVKKFREN